MHCATEASSRLLDAVSWTLCCFTNGTFCSSPSRIAWGSAQHPTVIRRLRGEVVIYVKLNGKDAWALVVVAERRMGVGGLDVWTLVV